MPRRKLPEDDLSDFLAELEERGAGNIAARRVPDVEGWFHVAWDEPGLPERSGDDDTAARTVRWSLILFLALFTVALVVLAELLGGLISSLITYKGGG